MKSTTKSTLSPRIMNARGVLSRELADLPVGGVLFAPFKYCSANNVKATVSKMRQNGFDFSYDNSGSEYSVITRTA